MFAALEPTMNWQDYGLVGAVVGFALMTTSGLVWWVVRGMRADMRRTLTLVEAAEQRAEEAQARFLTYVIDTAAKQSAAIVASTSTIERLAKDLDAAERRANQRHAQIMSAIVVRQNPPL